MSPQKTRVALSDSKLNARSRIGGPNKATDSVRLFLWCFSLLFFPINADLHVLFFITRNAQYAPLVECSRHLHGDDLSMAVARGRLTPNSLYRCSRSSLTRRLLQSMKFRICCHSLLSVCLCTHSCCLRVQLSSHGYSEVYGSSAHDLVGSCDVSSSCL